ncbi:hypothetical protein DFH27DRAFT_525024 [Peziza echinospora]|nr:hypothetical protein DFH27DRAFT_525024 [Peziza echinospora]
MCGFDKSACPLYILIDGLDECASRVDILEVLKTTDWQQLGVRYIITSRLEIDIQVALNPMTKGTAIDLNSDAFGVDADIKHFIKEHVSKKENKRLLRFRDIIISTLSEKSRGMFRYAALMLEVLAIPSNEGVEDILRKVPPGLGAPAQITMRKKVLTWIALAYEPITVHDMVLACATLEGEKEFNPDDKLLVDGEHLLTICGALIEISSTNTLQFTHFSVKEFLLQEGFNSDEVFQLDKGGDLKQYLLLQPSLAHLSIVHTCITQLRSKVFLKQHAELKSESESESPKPHFPEYRKVDSEGGHDVWSAVAGFLQGPTYSTWQKLRPKFKPSAGGDTLYFSDTLITGIHFCAMLGLTEVLEQFPKGNWKEQLAAQDREGLTPLHLAVAHTANPAMVTLLLEHGASVRARTEDNRTPLHMAASGCQNSPEVVALLLKYRADVGARARDGRTPLHMAASEGLSGAEVVALLLKHGADASAKAHDGRTPLHMATGSKYVASLLSGKGTVR